MNTPAPSELDILYPNRDITVGGETVTVKEYTLLQQMQHHAKFTPFVAGLRAILGDGSPDDIKFEQIMQALSDNYHDIIELVAISTGKTPAFIANLEAKEGEDLILLWWAVNSDFFTRKAVQPLIEKLAKTNAEKLIGANL
ncbi:DUF6631 family protein [Rodentibacter sp. Ppn85]|uniref:DUF6631 family protein n=1 Tax=Rodentibacter sp. Ppn85 TaxID=1908525 RepID=UPI000986155A|nr:DUF6631 family protein [Rodentibacter sp. Ppn85]OOF65127.1 hypothetical protein BKL51_06135 [Rodentibacter sp. Ppn85]